MADARAVLVIGSLNMDLVARCQHLPRPGQTVFGSDFFTASGGKGANQAVAAARLGARVTMAGCVGDDQFGCTLLNGLRADGVGCDLVQQAPGRRSLRELRGYRPPARPSPLPKTGNPGPRASSPADRAESGGVETAMG